MDAGQHCPTKWWALPWWQHHKSSALVCCLLILVCCWVLHLVADVTLTELLLHYIHLTAFFPGQPGLAGTRKANHSGLYCSKRWCGGSGISWTICKSFAPCSRQMTTLVPHHSVFTRRPDDLPAAQPTASKHWRHKGVSSEISKIVSKADAVLKFAVLWCA